MRPSRGGRAIGRATGAVLLLLALACRLAPPAGGTGSDEPSASPEYVVSLKKRAWEEALGGTAAARPHVKARLTGWPERLLADRASLPRTDAAFLARLARDTWRGLEALTDRENGLSIDHVRFAPPSVDLPGAEIGDYASATNIGLHLIAIVAARELGYLSPEAALARIAATLATLERLETFRGFFFNFYDTTSLERTSHFISFVDSSWLIAGLMVARNAVPELAERCTRLIEPQDFAFFYDPAAEHMALGYYVQRSALSPYHYGAFFTEARIGSLIAIGKGDVGEEHWFRMLRTFPPQCDWQTQAPVGRRTKLVRGVEMEGGWYEWNGYRYVPSWGGSMFEALMPTLVLDEMRYAPDNLGANARVHAELQRIYALDLLGYPVWGMSPAMVPGTSHYAEWGVPALGSRGYPPGVVTPHASALALAVTPEAAIANLRVLADRYDLYGEYGFYDAVHPFTGEVAYSYLALDQSMIFVAVANHLTGGRIQEWFAADPIVQAALPVLRDEKCLD